MKILHLEDDPNDAFLVGRMLTKHGIDAEITCAGSAEEFRHAVEQNAFDLVVVDSGVPGFSGKEALKLLRAKDADIPMIVCSGADSEANAMATLAVGATGYVLKDHMWQLVPAIKGLEDMIRRRKALEAHNVAMRRLVDVVQELSLARDLPSIMRIVRVAARELTGADGASFVLRDGDLCYYADENAIAPLWKGQRFPMSACVSGWVMLNAQPASIEDIYADPRVPADAYRPTFVQSLAMVPIRTSAPIGAIGNYWAKQHTPTEEEMMLLQALANTTAVALENVQVYSELEQRVKSRTRELEAANRELESFSSAVSHDLRAPLRSINAELSILLEDHGTTLNADATRHIERAQVGTRRMGGLIEDLLRLSRLSRIDMRCQRFNLSNVLLALAEQMNAESRAHPAEVMIEPGVEVLADPGLVRIVVDNLLSNAFKYSSKHAAPRVEFNTRLDNDERVFAISDNGAGFDMQYAEKLFQPFQRMHSDKEFPGTGIGLATVRRIIERHGGRIWVEAAPDKGATFHFTLGQN